MLKSPPSDPPWGRRNDLVRDLFIEKIRDSWLLSNLYCMKFRNIRIDYVFGEFCSTEEESDSKNADFFLFWKLRTVTTYYAWQRVFRYPSLVVLCHDASASQASISAYN